MKTCVVVAFLFFCSCKKSAFISYICRSTAVTTQNGNSKYTVLPDVTFSNVDRSEVDRYEKEHSSIDTLSDGTVMDTTTLCSRF